MNDEERRLFEALRDREIAGRNHQLDSTFDISEELGIPNDRALQYVRKWTDRGWYTYGLNELFGRLTAAGLEQ